MRTNPRGVPNDSDDQLAVSPDQIEGVYTGVHIAKLGSLAMFMQTTTGMILFIICPLLILVGWDVLRRSMDAKREKTRTQELDARLRELEGGQTVEEEGHQAAETRSK